MTKVVWKPIVATGCVLAAYVALPMSRLGVLSGISAALIYGLVVLLLAIWTCGGYRQFRDKYRPVLSE
jgi:hypothetical protein